MELGVSVSKRLIRGDLEVHNWLYWKLSSLRWKSRRPHRQQLYLSFYHGSSGDALGASSPSGRAGQSLRRAAAPGQGAAGSLIERVIVAGQGGAGPPPGGAGSH